MLTSETYINKQNQTAHKLSEHESLHNIFKGFRHYEITKKL